MILGGRLHLIARLLIITSLCLRNHLLSYSSSKKSTLLTTVDDGIRVQILVVVTRDVIIHLH